MTHQHIALLLGQPAAVKLAAEELLEIHRILDRLGAPREHHGEALSASQRLADHEQRLKNHPA